jgi:hypothetical protein
MSAAAEEMAKHLRDVFENFGRAIFSTAEMDTLVKACDEVMAESSYFKVHALQQGSKLTFIISEYQATDETEEHIQSLRDTLEGFHRGVDVRVVVVDAKVEVVTQS